MSNKKNKKTICLNMIVKNESAIIRATLENIISYIPIDYYVISDTGSEDNTPEIITTFFAEKGIKGELHHDKWENFAHNRNLALKYAEGKTDYVLVFDADDRFEGNLVLPELTDEDRLSFRMTNTSDKSNVYFRPLMIRNDGSFYWRGALHEYIEQHRKSILHRDILGDYYVIGGSFGARSTNPKKYEHDAHLLEQAFISGEDVDLRPRYAFYAAQSYRDANILEKSLEWYNIRVALEGWAEEVYFSLLQIAFLKMRLNYSLEEVQAAFLSAYEYRPQRAESLYHLASHLRLNDKIKQAYIYASAAANMPLSKDILFVDYSVYEWRAKDELAVAAYWVGNYQLCYTLCLELLENKTIPENDRQRFLKNLNFAKEKLGIKDE